MKKLFVSIFVTIFLISGLSTATFSVEPSQQVQITIPKYSVKLNGVVIDSEHTKYPLISYKGVTYLPMTWNFAQGMGLNIDWDSEKGLTISKGTNTNNAISQDLEGTNDLDAIYNAQIAEFNITVNGKRINNQVEQYPLILFRNVTYFPLTWRFACDEFGWKLNWSNETGLSVSISQDEHIEIESEVDISEQIKGVKSSEIAVDNDGTVYMTYSEYWDISYLYKEKNETKELLDRMHVFNFIIDGEYIYYSGMEDYQSPILLYRIQKDGNEKKLLVDKHISSFTVGPDKIYFANNEEGKIYESNLDGTNIKEIATEKVNDMIYYEGKLYYSTLEQLEFMFMGSNNIGAIKSIDLEKYEKETLVDDFSSGLSIYKGYIYFSDSNSDYELKRMNLDNKMVEELNIYTYEFGIDKDIIYFANLNDLVGCGGSYNVFFPTLYKFDLESHEQDKLTDYPSNSVFVSNNHIRYHEYVDNGNMSYDQRYTKNISDLPDIRNLTTDTSTDYIEDYEESKVNNSDKENTEDVNVAKEKEDNEIITFIDTELEKMLKKALNKASDITYGDIKNIEEVEIWGENLLYSEKGGNLNSRYIFNTAGYQSPSYYTTYEDQNDESKNIDERGKIKQTTDFSQFPNLQSLTINFQENLSLENIENLSQLYTLKLEGNKPYNISLLNIGKLTQLSSIHISYQELDNLHSISYLKELINLNLSNCKIDDISNFTVSNKLLSINIGDSNIDNISFLENTTQLKIINICNCSISDLSPISHLTTIERFSASNNNISDVSPLKNNVNMIHLGLGENPISEISSLEKMVNLQYLGLSGCRVSDISVLSNMTNLIRLILGDNNISCIDALSKLEKLEYINLMNNSITDFSPIDHLEEKAYIVK